jgi:hypothetical protein
MNLISIWFACLKNFLKSGVFGFQKVGYENYAFPSNEAEKSLEYVCILLTKKSPYLVLIEYFAKGNYCFLIMDYYGGGDLDNN